MLLVIITSFAYFVPLRRVLRLKSYKHHRDTLLFMAILILDYVKPFKNENGKWIAWKSLVKCDNCNKERITNKYSVLDGAGDKYCRKCSTLFCSREDRITKDDYLKLSIERNLEILIIAKISHEKSDWKCKICDFFFFTAYHTVSMTKNRGCPNCANNLQKTEDYYISIANRNGIKYLGPFPANSRTKTNWECKCGKVFQRDLTHVTRGRFDCRKCQIIKVTGENNSRYNSSLTDEERSESRRNKKYIDWSKSIYQRFKFKCAKCGINRQPEAHHLFNFADYPKLRLEPENGVCLCLSCHDNFHSEYGSKFNTLSQIELFLDRELSEINRDLLIQLSTLQVRHSTKIADNRPSPNDL